VPIIEVEHLHKRYRDTVAVEDVSFTVERGEIFGIVGPNGAGKTTTVETIEGLRTPDRGTVRVLGLDPRRDRAELRQRVGVQLQQSDLYDRVRVGEALELFASFYRDPADPTGSWPTWGWRPSATPASTSSRAASASGCRSPSPWWATPRSPSWTSSAPASTPTPAATPGG
jgi:ABC-type branched-subunit amino acid transport system ATPase component